MISAEIWRSRQELLIYIRILKRKTAISVRLRFRRNSICIGRIIAAVFIPAQRGNTIGIDKIKGYDYNDNDTYSHL